MKIILLKLIFFLLIGGCFVGCYQVSSNGDDDLVTIPTTNNPSLLPEGAGFGPMRPMAY